MLTLADDERAALFAQSRSFLAEVLGMEAQVRTDIPFAASVWRTHRLG